MSLMQATSMRSFEEYLDSNAQFGFSISEEITFGRVSRVSPYTLEPTGPYMSLATARVLYYFERRSCASHPAGCLSAWLATKSGTRAYKLPEHLFDLEAAPVDDSDHIIYSLRRISQYRTPVSDPDGQPCAVIDCWDDASLVLDGHALCDNHGLLVGDWIRNSAESRRQLEAFLKIA